MARKPMRHSNEYDRYWRLKSYARLKKDLLRPYIEAAGYQLRNNATKKLVVYYVNRLEKTLLCYYKCTDEELRKFIKDRDVVMGGERKRYSRKTCIEQLMAADDEQTFNRFEDLPPELRNQVYELYVATFPDTLYMPTQPPLARTSRLVMSECLPILYAQTRFELRFSCPLGLALEEKWPGDDSRSLQYVHALWKKREARVGKLRFVFKALGYGYTYCSVDVTLLKASPGYEVEVREPNEEEKEQAAVVEGEVRKVLETAVGGDGNRRLKGDDLYALRDAAQKGYQLATEDEWEWG